MQNPYSNYTSLQFYKVKSHGTHAGYPKPDESTDWMPAVIKEKQYSQTTIK